MENKTGKYIKYAIGEIFLVVIGILIALSINDWNQNRLNKIQVNGYLSSIAEDLKSDIAQFNQNIINYEEAIEKGSKLFLNGDYKELDLSAINDLIWGYWSVNKTSDQTFQKIKNTGLLDILGTPNINKTVNEYYNDSLVMYSSFITWDRELSERDNFFWSFNKNLESSPPIAFKVSILPYVDDEEKRKNDLIKLAESTLGRNYLRQALSRDELGIRVVKETLSKATGLLELINNEIEH